MDADAMWRFVAAHECLIAILFSAGYVGFVALVGILGRKHMMAERRRAALAKGH